jgi:hypothetical protein
VSTPTLADLTRTINMSTTSKTVGIKGVDTGKDYYWNKDSPDITQDSAGTVLTPSDTLTIVYKGYADVILSVTDTSEQTTRKTRAGNVGTGTVESVIDLPLFEDIDSYTEKAETELAQHGNDAMKLEFATRRTGLEAGQYATVNIPTLKLSNENMLIESVEIRMRNENGTITPTYNVSAVQGSISEGWTNFFKVLYDKNSQLVISTNASETNTTI